MRALIFWLMLLLPAWAAVVPDGKAVPRDDGAPVLPLTTTEANPLSGGSVSNVGRKPPQSLPGGHSGSASNANAGQPGSAPGPAGENSSSGANAAQSDAFTDSQPLEPVTPAAHQPVPWYLILLALGLLVATVVIGLMIRQDRGEPN